MDRWQGKVAVVTGSSSGIGAAVSSILVENGLTVVGLARRENKLKELAETLKNKKGKFHPLRADLSDEKDILDAFAWIENNLGGVHILVNNAGVLPLVKPVSENETDQLKKVLDLNVLALTICSREALRSMKANNIDDGNIINISSITAHMSTPLPGFAVYSATKRAVQAITEGMRIELSMENSNIKVTTICPGIVTTEIFDVAQVSLPTGIPYLQSEDVAETVLFCLKMPKTAQVTDLHIQPTGENLPKFFNGRQEKLLNL